MSGNVRGSGNSELKDAVAYNQNSNDEQSDKGQDGSPHQELSVRQAIGLPSIGGSIGDGSIVTSGRLVINAVRRLVDQNPKGAANALRGWIQDTNK